MDVDMAKGIISENKSSNHIRTAKKYKGDHIRIVKYQKFIFFSNFKREAIAFGLQKDQKFIFFLQISKRKQSH